MAYSELIKNFDKIRDYMRDFFIYGLRQEMISIRRVHAVTTMNGDALKAGYMIICLSDKTPEERMYSFLLIAGR